MFLILACLGVSVAEKKTFKQLMDTDDDELTDDELKIKYAPVHYGPVWERGEDGRFILPEHTLGWQIAEWCTYYLGPLGDGDRFTFTLEQLRFVLWWYAVDDDGRFVYPSRGMLQRIKGWGKDPLLAVLCLVEAFGPSVFSGWDRNGEPIGKRREFARVQLAAVDFSQTENTFEMFTRLVTDRLEHDCDVKVMSRQVFGFRRSCCIERLSASPRNKEGNRPTFILYNETQHWLPSNGGQRLKNTLGGNLSKTNGRSLAITNAPSPGEGSVAEGDRQSAMWALEGRVKEDTIFFDSLEAPEHAPVNERVFKIVYNMVRGDSVWCNADRTWEEVTDPTRAVSESRRMFYNQVWMAEGRLYSPEDWKRLERKDTLNLGDTVCLGFDGGKSDDATALVAVRVSDGLAVPLLLEERPPDWEGRWEVDREKVDSAVHKAFRDFNVVGFYADVALWESYIHEWELAYAPQLVVRAPNGPIRYDMRGSLKRTVGLHERFLSAVLEGKVSAGGPQGLLLSLKRHFLNVVRKDTTWGVSFTKDGRESKLKVDLYAAWMLAYGAYCEFQLEESMRVANAVEEDTEWFVYS